ncbi:MAG: hypothetical protein AAF725_15260, partial [Acidobacteriota bacterium]
PAWLIRATFLTTLLGLSVQPLAAQTADGDSAASSILLRPGVVVDTERDEIYLMAPGGGIEALDLTDGRLLWRSDVADQPLAQHAGGLLALRDSAQPGPEMTVKLLDSQGEEQLSTSLTLASDVRVRVDDGLGEKFRIASADGLIAWDYDARDVRGALLTSPTDESVIQQPNVIERRGAAQFDAAAGTLSFAGANSAGALALLESPRVTVAAGDLPPALQGGSDQRTFRSGDSLHLVITSLHKSPHPGERYRWRVYERATQKLLGTVLSATSYSPFLVKGNLVIREVQALDVRQDDDTWTEIPLSIEGVRLSDGQQLWARPLRETRFEGPFPP